MLQNQVPISNKPQAITTKDLQYLKVSMLWKLFALKKVSLSCRYCFSFIFLFNKPDF